MSFQRMGISENRNTDNTLHISKKEKKEAKGKCIVQQYFQKSQTKNKSLYEDSLTINGIEQFENYKKMVKLEQKRESAIGISRILFKESLRQRFERLQNIKTIQQLVAIPKYQQFCKMFFNLNTILVNQTLAFQEIVIQFKQDYQIEFKVQYLQQFLSIWNDAFRLVWKYYQNEKLSLEVGIKDQQFHQNDDKNIIFQQKLLDYIQIKGECIDLYPLPNMENIQQDIKNQDQESHSTHTIMRDQQHSQSNNQLKQIAIELQQYFHLRDVSNMYLINIEKYLIKKSNDLNSNNGILTIINNLISRYPEWITIVQGQTDKIVRINRAIDIKQLMLEYECLDCN
ncbi:unnamed protein product (macronuclear) [Paramecium tetraurelia]|uniref:CDT1 Geminin-binding domain-containing protein n=1 Tax=Paramecium tetraurelia TaxID=5888 RepID=A0D9Q5_PARTE|nr:uncharacterized protein GSPATT00014703001 [Paramecium tetraurelia]CAK79772.1 unnamed protein product [Paramecium tetraurelia]|eukprot:XP_001447169.1 hypothetical protein (macronuclear) [Paramecium tetraurelia strain d4-2]